MIKITNKNINEILEDNKYFNKKTIDILKYDIKKDTIDITIDNIKLSCIGIKECDIREYYSWEEIDKCFLSTVKFNNMDVMCFATSNDAPSIYIVCDEIKYKKKEK